MRISRSVHIVTLLAGLAITVVLLGDDKAAPDFKSAQVRAARAQFNTRVAEIQQESNTKITAARKQYIAELQKAKEDATRRADLDEAVRIRDELAAMQKELPAQTAPLTPWKAREALAADLAGTSWKLGGNPDLTLMADGTTSPHPEGMQGRWAPIGNRAIVITLENGWTDLWLFDDKLAKAKVTHAQLGGQIERTRAR
jgi:hypothetical protein